MYSGKGTTLASTSLPMTIKGFCPGCVVRQARSEKELWTVRFRVVWRPGKESKDEEQSPWEERRENIGKKKGQRECRKGKPKLTSSADPDAKGSTVNGRADLDPRWRSSGTGRLPCCGSVFPSPTHPSRNLQSTLSNSKIWTELHAWERPLIPTDEHLHSLPASAQMLTSLRNLPGLSGGVCHLLLHSLLALLVSVISTYCCVLQSQHTQFSSKTEDLKGESQTSLYLCPRPTQRLASCLCSTNEALRVGVFNRCEWLDLLGNFFKMQRPWPFPGLMDPISGAAFGWLCFGEASWDESDAVHDEKPLLQRCGSKSYARYWHHSGGLEAGSPCEEPRFQSQKGLDSICSLSLWIHHQPTVGAWANSYTSLSLDSEVVKIKWDHKT